MGKVFGGRDSPTNKLMKRCFEAETNAEAGKTFHGYGIMVKFAPPSNVWIQVKAIILRLLSSRRLVSSVFLILFISIVRPQNLNFES
jgi:hypothetical protein